MCAQPPYPPRKLSFLLYPNCLPDRPFGVSLITPLTSRNVHTICLLTFSIFASSSSSFPKQVPPMLSTRSPTNANLVATVAGRTTYLVDTTKQLARPRLWAMGSSQTKTLQSNETIKSVAFSPDGTLLATASLENTTTLWRVADGVCKTTLVGHTNAVMSVAFRPDGTLLATGSWDKTTKLWRVADGVCTATLVGHSSDLWSVAFSPDGTLLATSSNDKTTKLWRVDGGECTATLFGHRDGVLSVAFSPDGTLLATGSYDMTTKLWCVSSRMCTATLAGYNSNGVMSVAFSPDGTLLATGCADHMTKLWRVADGVCTATLAGHKSTVRSVAFSPDGTLLATCSNDKTTKLWRVADGICTATTAAHTQVINAVAFSPDSTQLATGSDDKTTKLWRVESACSATLARHTAPVMSVAFSPESTLLATCSYDKTTKLWRVADGVCTLTLAGHSNWVNAVAFSPDGTLLATSSTDYTTKLWCIVDGVCTETLVGHTSAVRAVAFSPDGTLLVTGGDDNTTKLWCIVDGVCTATLVGHTSAVRAVAFSPDGTLLATCSNDFTTKLWRVAGGPCTATLTGHSDGVMSVVFSPDGMQLATGSWDKTTRLWRVADGVCTATFSGHSQFVNAVAFSPDGTLLATGSHDNTTKLWRVAEGVRTATFVGHNAAVRSVVFAPDGTLLATSSNDKTTKLWRVADGLCTATLAGHTNAVRSVAFSPDGTLLATASDDKTTKLWCIADGLCTATLASGIVRAVAFSPERNGELVATIGVDGLCFLWVIRTGELVGETNVGELLGVGHLMFLSRGEECCDLEYCCGRSTTKFGVEICRPELIRNNKLKLDLPREEVPMVTPSKRSVPLFPHVSLGDVSVVAQIGWGSSCMVHRCEWRGRAYALKLYHPSIARAITREVAIAPLLQHPNIVRLVAIVDSANGETQAVGLLMELASDSLADVLASPSRPPQSTILRWLHEAAQGIEYAHQCKVVHSDIKPDNIMTVGNKQQHAIAKVADFGSASVLSTIGTSTTTVYGTAMFIAPEYGAGDTGPTTASDVFSFGMTMWCALAPQGTDHGLGNNAQVSRALDKGRRPPVAAIDPSYASLIERCWAAEPSARPSMVEVETALRSLVASSQQQQPQAVPSMLLWSTLLKFYGIEAACQALQFRLDTESDGRIFHSDAVLDIANPCFQLICSMAGSLCGKVQRVIMVGTDDSTANAFVTLHKAEMNSRAVNPVLRVKNPLDAASVAGLKCLKQSFIPVATAPVEMNSRAVNPVLRVKNPMDAASVAGLNCLKQSFIPVATAPGEPLPSARLIFAWHGTSPDRVAAVCRDGPFFFLPSARLLFAWHGTSPDNVASVCRDGPRSLRTTDCGYFGAGSYFALEATYAVRYSGPEPANTERPVIMYAVSVSQAKVITLERDYRAVEDPSTPHLHGFSQYCSGKPNTAVALAPGCDAHFIPVKDYFNTHPITGIPTPRDVGFQAVDESSCEAEAHEIVIGNHHRCIPIAVVYFKD
ncbi:WD40 repeat-containing protein, putative [Bodo saltans]|uniref:WD40 repeat-containing protein, putative n=1 Tax=Bodo saltans TaxID=75058 RepID=A0A0S4JSU6_BODSA|nr:WD40 repeat-containing protein, putative [Bodo saltans]|eukprot:CUG93315.1 WD40 repeat-containing protein, putative [Bodo saltans]